MAENNQIESFSGESRRQPEKLMDYVLAGRDFLRRRGCSSPRLDAELLLAHQLHRERLSLYLDFDRPLSTAEQEEYRRLLMRRGAGEPIAYILGEKEFYSLLCKVDQRVLVPRPETELLVELGLDVLPVEQPSRFADVGTGSGCIALALAHNRPMAMGWMTDISPDALTLARENVELHGLGKQLSGVEGNLLAPLRNLVAPGSLDLVVSNPPYIEADDPDLEEQVAAWEPEMALRPGDGGFSELCHRLASEAAGFLRPGGILAFECGATQASEAMAALGSDWVEVEKVLDQAGKERVVKATWPLSR